MTFKSFVGESNLGQEDKKLWAAILEHLDNDQIKVFEDFVAGDEANLITLTENFKSKKLAFQNNDEKALDKILENE